MKSRYVIIGLSAFAIGFAIQSSVKPTSPALPEAKPSLSAEAVDARFREIVSIGQPGLELFFKATGRPGLVYLYRSDCKPCDSQWSELQPLMKSMPVLVISVDDKRSDLAERLAANNDPLTYVPLHVPARRMLTVRTWLRDHGCRFSGNLPFVAVSDGHGNCSAAWEGVTSASTIESAANSLKNNDSSASAIPVIQ